LSHIFLEISLFSEKHHAFLDLSREMPIVILQTKQSLLRKARRSMQRFRLTMNALRNIWEGLLERKRRIP